MLGKIASMLGKPSGIDKLTNDKIHLSYAWILVEIDAACPPKDFILLKGLMFDC